MSVSSNKQERGGIFLLKWTKSSVRDWENRNRKYFCGVALFLWIICLLHMEYSFSWKWPIFLAISPVVWNVCIHIGLFFHKEFESYFLEFEWEENEVYVEYRMMKRFLQGLGVFILSLYSQLPILLIIQSFLPEIELFGVPLIVPFIIANCVATILFYKENIWTKWEGKGEALFGWKK